MAELKAGTLSAPNVKFTQIPTRAPLDTRESQLSTLIKGAEVAGRQFAKRSGAEVAGADLTQEQVNEQARQVDLEIDASLTAEQNLIEGPLQESRVNEIKDVQLSAFAQNDRVLLALRDQGTISTVEARARRRLNLQRELSNPINALFKKDFLNAASDLTGGGRGAASALFVNTPEEERALAIQAEQTKQIAEFEGKVTANIQASGKTDSVVRAEMAEQTNDEQRRLEIARIKEKQGVTGELFSEDHALIRNSTSRGLYLQMAAMNKEAGGNGLDVAGMQTLKQTVDQQYRGMLQAINAGVGSQGEMNIGSKERDAEIAKLNAWHDGMKTSMELYDGSTYDESLIKQLDQAGTLLSYKHLPELMLIQKNFKDLAPLILTQGGINENINNFVGPGTDKKLLSITKQLTAISSFGKGKPPKNEQEAQEQMAVITNNGGQSGLEIVTGPAVQGSPQRKNAFAKLYDAASGVALQSYNSTDSQRMSLQNDVLRNEMNTAMVSTKDKIERIKGRIGAQEALIWAEKETFKTTGGLGRAGEVRDVRVGPSPQWILNLPDGMQEYAPDLKEMHTFVQKHPWSWGHVKENYIDASDAFNGYMRGEWDVNVELLDPPVDEGDDKDGKASIEQQQADIRDKPRERGLPLKPGAIKIAEALSEAPKSFISDKTTNEVRGIDKSLDELTGAPTKFPPTIPKDKSPPIAVQHNNPGNLRAIGIDFEGKTGEVDTSSGVFATFSTPEAGMRALARDLHTKIGRGVDTIQKIIEVYSPDTDPENQRRGFLSQNYVDFIVRQTGIDANKKLKGTDRAKIMDAITRFESGFQPWSKALIKEGIRLADGE